uniref:Uncharacterized protein n=1 Tax=Meloidogyne enterolobii TaxID=390850 RepID=A0A6V7TSZ3_MELEN|nr:unnamed protein product [Meloidogyne enterolobii]
MSTKNYLYLLLILFLFYFPSRLQSTKNLVEKVLLLFWKRNTIYQMTIMTLKIKLK